MLHHLITGNILNSFIRHETVQKIFEESSYSIKPFPDNNFRLQAYEFGGNIHKILPIVGFCLGLLDIILDFNNVLVIY